MAKFQFGGDPESFMDPPSLQGDSSGGGLRIIQKLFEVLGITHPVAKEPKAPKAPKESKQGGAPKLPYADLGILDQLDTVLAPVSRSKDGLIQPLFRDPGM
jgi:hypothetical protein